MATELKSSPSRTGQVKLTRFFGGAGDTGDGVCLQLTPVNSFGGYDTNGYIQLTKAQALELAIALIEFASGTRAEE